jgi:hypothetical protein
MQVTELMEIDTRTVIPAMRVSEVIVALDEMRDCRRSMRANVVGVVWSTDIIGAKAETHRTEERRSCWMGPEYRTL